MIKVENLTKYYGETLALDGISFEISKGEIVGFLGPNAAGKTTTMRILTCYLSPTKGRAFVGEYNVLEKPLEVKRIIGYLPEMNPLYDDMGVIEYLEFIGKLRDYNGKKLQSRIKEVVQICGLKDVLSKNIGELSRGYRQRVGFSQAILHEPEVLIMDEPTTGLDPNQAREVRQLIKELKKEKTVILSTHILSEVQATCDRVIIINKGKIVAEGTTEELQSKVQAKEKVYIQLAAEREKVEPLLKTVAGVESVVFRDTENGRSGFEIESSVDIRPELFKVAVKNDWTVYELHRETVSLDELFRKLTTEE